MPPLGELWPIVAATLPVAGFAALLLGAFISLVNFYLSFVRNPLRWLRGHDSKNVHHPSGIPLFGSLLLWLGAMLLWNWTPVAWTAIAISLFDTGGPVWLVIMLFSIWIVGSRR